MVWHSSQKFGCGKAKSRSGKVIVVAYYEPRGNIPQKFHENVLPPAIVECEDDQQDSIIVPPQDSLLLRRSLFDIIRSKHRNLLKSNSTTY
jgi:hypothetical protein